MNNEILVASAKEDDQPSIKTLLAELSEAMEHTSGFDSEQWTKNCRKLMHKQDNYMLVARDGDNIRGFINFTTRDTIMHTGPSGLIDELVVSKRSRGRGIGKKLIRAAIEKCRELECCEVEVSTEKSNRNARHFYRSCGFEEDAVLLEYNLESEE
jgi:ribosomal protein S18 acetylase RimI-like enzyme